MRGYMSSPRKDLRELGDYLFAKLDEGAVTPEELDDVIRVMVRIVSAAGGVWKPADSSINPIAKQAAFQMKTRLLELHPELRREIEGLDGRGRSR